MGGGGFEGKRLPKITQGHGSKRFSLKNEVTAYYSDCKN